MEDDDDRELEYALMAAPMLGTILDDVVEGAENFLMKRLEDEQLQEKTFFVLGNRTAGKSTMVVDAFDLSEEQLKPSLVLDSFCAFHICDNGYQQKLCNIWELAGGSNHSPALMTIKAPKNLTAVIVLDLSSPSTLWHTAVTSLEILRKYVEIKYDNLETQQEIPDTHKEKNLIKPFPVPLFFVGGKYDLFQDFEPEKKRVICQFLRYIAHVNYGFLFFYSSKLNNLSKTAKEIFCHHAFGTPFSLQEQFEYTQPLMIPPGTDSFESIEGQSNIEVTPPMSKYKNILSKYFKQNEDNDQKYPDNPRFDPNYKEPTIDFMRHQRSEELEKLIEEAELAIKTKKVICTGEDLKEFFNRKVK